MTEKVWDTPTLEQHLIQVDETLPNDRHDRIIAQGKAIVPALLGVLNNERQVTAHRDMFRRHFDALLSRTRKNGTQSQKKPGRNDPCWCGSGKKYKKCHLDADRATSN